MDENSSFLMIKPDCLIDQEQINEVCKKLEEYKLIVIDKFEILLTLPDINILWPSYRMCKLTQYFMKAYLADKKLPIWVVKGERATDKLNEIKKDIRNRLGKGCFANCIHTPKDNYEATWQYEMMYSLRIENGQQLNRKSYDEFIEKGSALEIYNGGFGRLYQTEESELEQLAVRVLHDRQERIQQGIQVPLYYEEAVKSHSLYLLNEDSKGIDEVIAILDEIFPDAPLEELVHIVLDVDFYGERILVSGSINKIVSIYKDLSDKYNLQSKIQLKNERV